MKTEVYSWRLSTHLKDELQEAARAERKSLSELLEEIAKDWLQRTRALGEDEKERQRRLHEEAMKFFGTIDGGPDLAANARSEVRARIARRHGQ
jgi:flagellar motility protein MotE (MotC chaperone)